MAEGLTDAPESLQAQEIVVRLENNTGGFNAFALDTVTFARRLGETYPSFAEMVPSILKPAVDAFMFAIRHGILQRLCRDRGIPMPDKNAKKYDEFGNEVKRDLNAEAAELLAQVFYHDVLKKSRDADGQPIAVDVTSHELKGAYAGIFRRLPAYDQLGGPGAEPTAIDAPDTEQATATAAV